MKGARNPPDALRQRAEIRVPGPVQTLSIQGIHHEPEETLNLFPFTMR